MRCCCSRSHLRAVRRVRAGYPRNGQPDREGSLYAAHGVRYRAASALHSAMPGYSRDIEQQGTLVARCCFLLSLPRSHAGSSLFANMDTRATGFMVEFADARNFIAVRLPV